MKPMISDPAFDFLCQLVHKHLGLQWDQSKKNLAYMRLHSRLTCLGISNFDEYCSFLQSPDGEAELQELFDAVTTNHTQFFREKQQLDYLQQKILAKWQTVPAYPNGRKIRAWSAGCSTGEEPYTLAMIFFETFGSHQDVRILASDISQRVLRHALEGIYGHESIMGIPKELVGKYFKKGNCADDVYYQVNNFIQDIIQFRMINLLDARFPIKVDLDLIFFRNVMIYFDKACQKKIIHRFRDHLRTGGYLCLGHSETILDVEGFSREKYNIYQKL